MPERTAVKMDKDLPLEKLGPLGCGVVTGAGGVIEALKVGFGDTIAVFGVGGVGLVGGDGGAAGRGAGGSSRSTSCPSGSSWRASSARPTRSSPSEDGVADKIRAVTGRGVDFTFNTTTVPAVHTWALEALAMNGTAGFVAAPRGEWAPQMFAMLAGGRQLRGILGGDAHPGLFIPRLVEFWRQGRFPFDRLLTFLPVRRDRARVRRRAFGQGDQAGAADGRSRMTPELRAKLEGLRARPHARDARRDDASCSPAMADGQRSRRSR